MEKKPVTNSAVNKSKPSNISVNNNARRSASKSPARPRTPTGSIKNVPNDLVPIPILNSGTSNHNPNKTKSNGNVSGNAPSNLPAPGNSSTPAKKSTANVVGPSEANVPKKIIPKGITKSIMTSDGNTGPTTSTSNYFSNNTDAPTSVVPVSTISKVSTTYKSLGTPSGATLNFYKNTAMNMSRSFPRPLSNTSNFRSGLAKSAMGLNKSQNSSAFRASVEKAVREHKIYTIVGMYPAIRNALKKRGWIEKNFTAHMAMKTLLAQNQNRDLSDLGRGSEEESDQAWLVRVLRDYPPDFIWVIRRDNIEWRLLHKDQIINRYPKAFFTTKVGIAACLQNIHWYSEPGVAEILFPRCYRICLDEEKQAFIEDFRLTACFGFLKLFVLIYEKDGDSGFHDGNNKMTSMNLEFAMRNVNNYIRMRRHEDIDWLIPPILTNNHWEPFLQSYYEIAQGRQKFNWKDSTEPLKSKVEQIRRINQRAAIYWPQYHIDGNASLWICKPGARSRGKGIVILSQLDKVLELLTSSNFREANWVAQKYIERPLLIYKTKFDIRQWFVITDWTPLTIWFYKESYIRFCTKPFTLVDFHESVHLCNNAVQCRYTNSELRDTALPEENMWDCYTFQAYLNTIGKMDAWDKTIYPGMKQAIIGVLLASQETVDNRKNCFELYGADFMLSEDLKPWLIEINSCPCMSSSTSVTARLCASCLEDCIKVVLDRRDDRNSETGYFEMIYKQNVTGMHTTLYGGNDLVLQGRKLNRDIDWPGIMTKYNSKRGSSSTNGGSLQLGHLTPRSETPSIYFEGMTFVDLVERLRMREDENQTTPHAQKTMENSIGASLQTAIRNYRTGQKTQQQPEQQQQQNSSKITIPYPNNSSDNLQTNPASNLDTSGILKVKKLQTGPPDPVILYNGLPSNTYTTETNRTSAVSYSEMYPLFSHLSSKPQNFVTFGNRATQNKSVYGNAINGNTSKAGYPSTNDNGGISGKQPVTYAYPTAPLSLLTGHQTPVAATMADLLRLSQNTSGQGVQFQKGSIYGRLTEQQGTSKQPNSSPMPMMLINPMRTTKSLKIRPGPPSRSTHVSPMRVPNPAPTTNSVDRNKQKYGKIWTHYKIKTNAKLNKTDKRQAKMPDTSNLSDSSSAIVYQNINSKTVNSFKRRANKFVICKHYSPTPDRTSCNSGPETGRKFISNGKGKSIPSKPIITKPTSSNSEVEQSHSPNPPFPPSDNPMHLELAEHELPLSDEYDSYQAKSSTSSIKQKILSSSNLVKKESKFKSEINLDFLLVAAKESVTINCPHYSPVHMIYPATPTHSHPNLETHDTDDDLEESQEKETIINIWKNVNDKAVGIQEITSPLNENELPHHPSNSKTIVEQIKSSSELLPSNKNENSENEGVKRDLWL